MHLCPLAWSHTYARLDFGSRKYITTKEQPQMVPVQGRFTDSTKMQCIGESIPEMRFIVDVWKEFNSRSAGGLTR